MKIKYDNSEKTSVSIALDDKSFLLTGVTQAHHQWNAYVKPFIDEGGVIETYNELVEVKSYTPNEFRDQFTDEQQLAILKASDSDDNLRLLMHKLYTTPHLSTDSSQLQDGIAYLVSEGLCSEQLADQILGND